MYPGVQLLRENNIPLLAAGLLIITECGIAAVLLSAFLLFSCASGPSPAGSSPRTAASLEAAIEWAVVEIAGKLPSGTKIAVISFASESSNISDYLMEELDFALANRNFTVADRANLASVRKELDFQMSGEVSDETAQSVGQFLGVEYVVTGQFLFIGDTYRLRVITERTETATRVVTTSINVKNDAALQKLVATLKSSRITTHEAGY